MMPFFVSSKVFQGLRGRRTVDFIRISSMLHCREMVRQTLIAVPNLNGFRQLLDRKTGHKTEKLSGYPPSIFTSYQKNPTGTPGN